MISQAGELQHKLVFERRSAEVDDVGQSARDWEQTAERWGKIEPIRSMRPESETAAGQDQSIVRYWITVPGYFECRPEDRIRHADDGRIWGISQVLGEEGKAPLYATEIRLLAFTADQMEESK